MYIYILDVLYTYSEHLIYLFTVYKWHAIIQRQNNARARSHTHTHNIYGRELKYKVFIYGRAHLLLANGNLRYKYILSRADRNRLVYFLRSCWHFRSSNMATAHQVSVITNSCYKAPVSRQTVLPATGNDESTLGASWFGRDADYLDDNSNMRFSESVNFDTTNTMADTLNVVDLSELTDEEFYKRLSDLKSEHKKTLELCEKLYNDKLLESRTGTAPTDAQQVPVAVALVDADYVLTASRTHTGKDISSPSTDLSKSFDRVRDMSASKPPIARPSRSSGTPARSGSAKKQAWTRSNENFWKSPSTNSSDAEFSGNETERSKLDRSLEALNISRASYMSRIEDMWDNFSVDNYAPRDKHKVRPRSSSLSRISTSRSLKQDELSSSQQWRHRITVPSPFKMTLREANKMPKKTKAMLELEQKREEERRQEDAECQKKFKARPVPSHVYMPLFQEIMEEKESKRRYVQKASAEMLLSMQKPFKFDIREKEEKKFRRTHSTPCDTDINKKPPTSFKARPFPVRIFDDEIDERLREEEEYRKIRIQMRSEELLRSASLPPNMAAKGHEYTEGKLRHKIYAERAKKAGLTTEHKFKPTINGTVPDFEKKHKKVLVEAMKRKDQKEATVCKPFRLHSASLHKDYHKMSHGHFADENEMRHKRSRTQPLSKSCKQKKAVKFHRLSLLIYFQSFHDTYKIFPYNRETQFN